MIWSCWQILLDTACSFPYQTPTFASKRYRKSQRKICFCVSLRWTAFETLKFYTWLTCFCIIGRWSLQLMWYMFNYLIQLELAACIFRNTCRFLLSQPSLASSQSYFSCCVVGNTFRDYTSSTCTVFQPNLSVKRWRGHIVIVQFDRSP